MGLKAMLWAFEASIANVGAKFTLVALAEHAGDHSGEDWTCYPSIRRLADFTSQGERTVERHVAWLEAEGWISKERRHRKGRRDAVFLYTIHRDRLAQGASPANLAGSPEAKPPAKLAGGGEAITRQIGGDHPPTSTGTPANLAAPYKDEPVNEPVIEPSVPSAREVLGFDEFWAAYPNKVEERGARAIFGKLIRQGDATAVELVEGAKLYARHVAGRDPKLVKHPTTWLTKGCWTDDLPSPAPITQSRTGAPAPTFDGPVEVWDAIASRKGSAWAESWLNPCAWLDDRRALQPRTSFAARRLQEELGPLLRELGVAVVQPMGAAA